MSEHVTVPWSRLLQQPNQVVSLLEEAAAVRLARRDAEDLIITTTSRMDVVFHGIEGVGRFAAASAKGWEELARHAPQQPARVFRAPSR